MEKGYPLSEKQIQADSANHQHVLLHCVTTILLAQRHLIHHNILRNQAHLYGEKGHIRQWGPIHVHGYFQKAQRHYYQVHLRYGFLKSRHDGDLGLMGYQNQIRDRGL
jgi:hypothetical protein